MNKKRYNKFALGYNGDENLINELGKLTKYIDSIYFGLPLSYSIKSGRRIDVDLDNLYSMSKSAEEKDINKILLFNSPHFLESGSLKQLLDELKNELIPLIKKLNVDSVITNHSIVGEYLKNKLGDNLKLGTSTLNNLMNKEELERFKKRGFDYFTLGREASRDIELLKKLSSEFKLKILVNESCLRFCEYQSQHIFYTAFGVDEIERLLPCRKCKLSEFFNSNWLLPRWLEYLDDYIYRFKLVTRTMSTERIKKTVEAYGEGLEVDNFFDIINSGTRNLAKSKLNNLNTQLIPDKVLTDPNKNYYEELSKKIFYD